MKAWAVIIGCSPAADRNRHTHPGERYASRHERTGHLVREPSLSDDLHVTGVSFPGLPLVIAGHNEHLAWGFTNGFPDVQDLYMEHLRRTPDGKTEV